uniref:Uncharacterized protein n=1 Tax=Arundo donax TaxID=35708 RepID=A0A0A8ZBL4_ARUDO
MCQFAHRLRSNKSGLREQKYCSNSCFHDILSFLFTQGGKNCAKIVLSDHIYCWLDHANDLLLSVLFIKFIYLNTSSMQLIAELASRTSKTRPLGERPPPRYCILEADPLCRAKKGHEGQRPRTQSRITMKAVTQ